MDEKNLKNIEKWKGEISILEEIKAAVAEFAELKDGKAPKEEIAPVNDKVVGLFDDNSFVKMDWLEVKRSKASREEGISKIEKKISDRLKKIEKAGGEAEEAPEEEPEEEIVEEEVIEEAEPERDWSEEIEKCAPGAVYYHWAYGKLEVLAMEGDYIYLRPLDRKGCKHEWLTKNNAIVEIDGEEEDVKEFSITSIGRWLFPEVEDVDIIDPAKAHKMFAK